MTYGDIVKNLIARGEDDRLVFIANWDEVAISKALVALLNAAGGDILVGIGEAGAVTGVGNQQSTERELSLRLGGRMVPEAPFSLNRLIYTKVNIIQIGRASCRERV